LKTCGLLGRNIQYSKSPELHNNYYKENNLDLEYRLFDIKEEELDKFILNLHREGIIGFNVTIPYKESIIKYLSEVRYPADMIKAVNTVLVLKDKLIGYNTDYYGFKKSLEENQVSVAEKNALIIGSGGSAKCVYYALLDYGIKEVDVVSRDYNKAKKSMPENCNIVANNGMIRLEKYDIIINCTPLGGSNYPEDSPLDLKGIKEDTVVYDLNYIPEESKLLLQAKELGGKTINGTSMLKYQAYYAIDIWCTENIIKGEK